LQKNTSLCRLCKLLWHLEERAYTACLSLSFLVDTTLNDT
jgi:hypothetical protein